MKEPITPTRTEEPIPLTSHRKSARKNAVARPSPLAPGYERLHTASQSLEHVITDLEQDWNVRDQAFWQQALQTLQSIRQALRPVITSLKQGSFLEEMTFLNTAYLADEHIDEAGILITTHASARRPRREAHLRQRHQILSQLQEIAADLQDIVSTGNRK
jgi:hypothetical protein